MIKKIIVLLFICCVFPINVCAQEVIDVNQNGSIDVTLRYQEKEIKDGTLSIYLVANVQQNNADMSFVLTSDFKDSHLNFDKIESSDTAKQVEQYIQDQQIAADQTIQNTNGKIVFEDLKPGLYLITQKTPSTGYYSLNPFFVSLPVKDQTTGTYQYHVSASGKFEMIPTTDTPHVPEKPTDPKLPQTGQLNWPIPVLTVGGMAIFVFGWVLHSKKN